MQLFKQATLKLFLLVGLASCVTSPAPSGKETHLEYGLQNSRVGDWDSFIKASTKSINSTKDKTLMARSYTNRCTYRIWKGQKDQALDDCNSSIQAKPNYFATPYAARGRIFAIQGNYKWALGEFDMAIKLGAIKSVGDNPLVIAFGGKARIYATSTQKKFRNKELALKFAKKAVDSEEALKTPAYKILNRDTLAAAYAEAGRFEDAIKEQEKTIILLKDKGWSSIAFSDKTLLQILNTHLIKFKQRQPLRGGVY